ncbi:hypothetical protein A8V37_18145 [Escherichia coli]|nr:hypothetical protein A8V37_18145 [Escherichia coli]
MMSLWDALRMNMMISYQELVRTFPSIIFVKNKFGCNENAQRRKKGGNNFPPKTLTLLNCRLKMPPAHNSPV